MIDLIVVGELSPTQEKELVEAYAAVRKYYEMAEQKLKLIEGIDELYIPSINELRYAGCHLSKATIAKESTAALKELDKAQKHCKRAIYDALEVGITYYLEELQSFFHEYRFVVLAPIIPNLTVVKKRISEIRDFITAPRDPDTRDQFWESCTNKFSEIKLLFETLELNRDEINKIVSKQAKEERRDRHTLVLRYVGISLAILGLVAAVYYNYFMPNNSNSVRAQTIQELTGAPQATGGK